MSCVLFEKFFPPPNLINTWRFMCLLNVSVRNLSSGELGSDPKWLRCVSVLACWHNMHSVALHFARLSKGMSESTITRPARKSMHPFWISREPVAWPWCILAGSQMRPYCLSVNSHSSVGLVSRQWDAVDWPCVLCDRRIYKYPKCQRRI